MCIALLFSSVLLPLHGRQFISILHLGGPANHNKGKSKRMQLLTYAFRKCQMSSLSHLILMPAKMIKSLTVLQTVTTVQERTWGLFWEKKQRTACLQISFWHSRKKKADIRRRCRDLSKVWFLNHSVKLSSDSSIPIYVYPEGSFIKTFSHIAYFSELQP